MSSDTDSVNKLIRGIQRTEFNFTKDDFPQPELFDIENFYIASGGNFWVAILDDDIVGTAAMLDLGNGISKLGRMFVDLAHRGTPYQIAQRLLDTALDWAKLNKINQVCFETTPETCAAHFFYRRNKFIEVSSTDFPPEYPLCPYPSRYFLKNLN